MNDFVSPPPIPRVVLFRDAVVYNSIKPKFRSLLFVGAPLNMKIDILSYILVPVSEDPRGGARKPLLAHGLKVTTETMTGNME